MSPPRSRHSGPRNGHGAGYKSLVDEGTFVSYSDGMDAAGKLAEELRKGLGQHDSAHMMAPMNRVIETVKEFVPRQEGPDLPAALRGEVVPPSPITAERAGAPSVLLVPISDRDDDDD